MRHSRALRYGGLSITAIVVALSMGEPAAAQTRTKKPPPKSVGTAGKVVADPCGDIVGFQVLLDRQGSSPGEIDGRAGRSLAGALTAFQASKKLAATGKPDCDAWSALGGDAAGTLIAEHVL